MDNIIKIKIEYDQRQETFKTARETFWAPFQSSPRQNRKRNNEIYDSNRTIESYELSIEKKFGEEISDSLIRYWGNGIFSVLQKKGNQYKWGLMNDRGRAITPCKYDGIEQDNICYTNLFIVWDYQDDNGYYIDIYGNEYIEK